MIYKYFFNHINEHLSFNSAILMTASVLIVGYVWIYLRTSPHPDDECMFFGPTIKELTKNSNVQVYLMCLSDGNYEGKGTIRISELYKSCKILGMKEENILVCKNGNFLDNPNVYWETTILADKISEHAEKLGVDILLTFDNYGVSGHRNHISIYMAFVYLMYNKTLPNECCFYTLDSVNIVRKYIKCLDNLFNDQTDLKYMLLPTEQDSINKAMQAHSSQYVWFRKLFMRFSRYKIVNTYTEISKNNL
ncbi:N-acetylglucosaminyl-phosphatidylinositol de-N-acetylase isoform X2 [Daktulosphaira vitifoliae]|uniref:N-acetylglucosaminyl-phosphatidylinositol de-N-acetylase isoform X2 n=1 Tax=Daktulosphaira vitifoliae TaxID=58002 RepID=UPI0021AAF4F8|nr:N-acetylglucosaminyl-phosphatidylinositol de-N-acetylase isoform X2 [Daktulosphaira vitifoliae]